MSKATSPTSILASILPSKEQENYNQEMQQTALLGLGDIANVSSESRGPIAPDDLDIADELSAIKITGEDHRQSLEELAKLETESIEFKTFLERENLQDIIKRNIIHLTKRENFELTCY